MSGCKIVSTKEMDKIILNNYKEHLAFLEDELIKHKDNPDNIKQIKSAIKKTKILIEEYKNRSK